MKIRLHEIELGVDNTESAKEFYHSALGLHLAIDQGVLKVFDPGVKNLDLNFSRHLPSGEVLLSFLCDDLEAVMQTLSKAGIQFEGPSESHLGLLSISFKDPAGYSIKINMPTEQSPEWLKNNLA